MPGIIGGLVSWSWWAVLTGLFWAGLVRVSFLHHVTWAVNSICHMIGERPFASRDKTANFWPVAILSAGENPGTTCTTLIRPRRGTARSCARSTYPRG